MAIKPYGTARLIGAARTRARMFGALLRRPADFQPGLLLRFRAILERLGLRRPVVAPGRALCVVWPGPLPGSAIPGSAIPGGGVPGSLSARCMTLARYMTLAAGPVAARALGLARRVGSARSMAAPIRAAAAALVASLRAVAGGSGMACRWAAGAVGGGAAIGWWTARAAVPWGMRRFHVHLDIAGPDPDAQRGARQGCWQRCAGLR